MSSNDIAISVENLSKRYEIYATPRDRLKQFVLPPLQRFAGKSPKEYFREFWAVKDVSFEVRRGETVGIVGRNASGYIATSGRIAALLELGSGFNPEFTGRENVYMNAAILGLSKEEIDKRYN